MIGPFAVIIRRCGGGWEMRALFRRENGRVTRAHSSWDRTRAGLLDTVRVVLK